MDSGVGFSGLRRLCWWLDSPCAATCVREAYADIDPGMTQENVRELRMNVLWS